MKDAKEKPSGDARGFWEMILKAIYNVRSP
jgi:hypothetical protein